MKKAILAIYALGLSASTANAQAPAFNADTLGFIKSFRANSLVSDTVKPQLPETVTLRKELNTLFDKNGCTLPVDLKKALKKQTGKESLIPKDLQDLLDDKALEGSLQPYPGQTANAVLHSVTIPNGSGTFKQLSLVGAESYSKKSAADFQDSENSDFAFTMDCSGYLNAALRTDVKIPAAQMTSAADTALKDKRALMVMRAHVYSPAAAVMDTSIGGAGLVTRHRIDLLYAIIAEVTSDAATRGFSAPDTTPITAWRKVDVVWTSNQGDSSMTGRASVAGSTNVGVGLATVSASGGAGGEVSRRVKFNSFNTYILEVANLAPVQRPLSFLKSSLQEELRKVRPEPASTVNGDIEVLYPTIPQKACLLNWTPSAAGIVYPGALYTSWSDAGCKLTFKPASSLAAGTLLDVKASAIGVELAFTMQLPKGQ